MARMTTIRLLGVCLLSLAACSDPDDGTGPVGAPDAVGARIADALAGIAQVDRDVITLAHQVREPTYAYLIDSVSVDSCTLVEDRLWQVCSQVGGDPCWVNATAYWAHDIPRCSARLEIASVTGTAFSQVYAVDFAGVSRINPRPDCGDGVLADGEDCDDGNLEAFDGCDPDCKAEPFNGCETVIQEEFSAANIAWVDAATWRSPRSHLMVHDAATAFDPFESTLCDRAATTAAAVCNRLSTDMPFVSWCQPETHLTSATTCDVRLLVQFLRPSPDDGVFTTALQGVLAFTIQ
jgi:cysteine-rich repeat protein